MSKFKVLFLYPNGTLMNPPAIAIGIFTALLKLRIIPWARLYLLVWYLNSFFFEQGIVESNKIWDKVFEDRLNLSNHSKFIKKGRSFVK